MRRWVSDALFTSGLALVLAACFMLSRVLGFFVLGAVLAAMGILLRSSDNA